jgi:23S rRNA (uracil1939-C5)-methyltransferase
MPLKPFAPNHGADKKIFLLKPRGFCAGVVRAIDVVKIALDLYAGVGLFAAHLAKRFEQVFAVESSPASAADLKANAIKNVVPVKATVESFLPRSLNMNPDVVVVDPPRSGLGARASQLLAALRVKRLVYVACDPATLARDVRTFLDFGYQVEQVHLLDLFPQTFHLESVIRLVR